MTPLLWILSIALYAAGFLFQLDFALSHIGNPRLSGNDLGLGIGVLFLPGLAVLFLAALVATILRFWDIRSRWVAAAALAAVSILVCVSIGIAVAPLL